MTPKEVARSERRASVGRELRRTRRQDGPEKVTGEARYTADVAVAGMTHAAVVESPWPHARIVHIDTDRAREMPGVVGIVTQADLPARLHGRALKDRPLLADGVVRFVGELVAMVAAMTLEQARAAAAAVVVQYEPLPPILEPEEALEPGALEIHPGWRSYEALTVDGATYVRAGNDCGYTTVERGDVEAGFAEAAHVVTGTYRTDMSHAVPIEPHAVVAQWQGSKLTVWSSSQVPFQARDALADVLELPVQDVRVVVPYLGGGFGGKCEMHFEPHVAALARAARRPVRLVHDRRQEFTLNDMCRHPISVEVTSGVRSDGTLCARSARVVLDTGAYAGHGPLIAEVATMVAPGPYRIPHLRIEGHCVYTNKTPAGSVRAPSGPQVVWAVEQHTDELARTVGLDPLEFRRRNLLRDGDRGPTGQPLTAVGVLECLDRAAEAIDWNAPREADEGVGVACTWWLGATPIPSEATVKLNPDGTAQLLTGAQENGSGAVMGLAILVADELGLRPEQVGIAYQDTDLGIFDQGSESSQTTVNNGRAVEAAARAVAGRLRELAAEDLEASLDDIELREGFAGVVGAPASQVAIASLAADARAKGEMLLRHGSPILPELPDHDASGCVGRVVIPAFAAPSFSCHAARVRVDRDTGVVEVLEVAAAHDSGWIINPVGAEGQVEGGVVHGVGIALSEGTVFAAGRQVNAGLLGYKLTTASDAPRITVRFVETNPERGGPRGSKGIGEQPVIATPGAIANAITDAIGSCPAHLPMTPERVWSAAR